MKRVNQISREKIFWGIFTALWILGLVWYFLQNDLGCSFDPNDGLYSGNCSTEELMRVAQ